MSDKELEEPVKMTTLGPAIEKKIAVMKPVVGDQGSGRQGGSLFADTPTEEPSLSIVEQGVDGLYGHESSAARATPVHLRKMEDPPEPGQKKANLGIMIGVYLPTMQNIFGVLMFLRLPWIVGVMGILQSFIMVFICCLCTFLTCISMSAIATNGVVESGGSYFMISRNLGATIGTAVGILFYFANTVATSMYIVGGVEILLVYLAPALYFGDEADKRDLAFFGHMMMVMRLYGTVMLVFLFLLVLAGVKFVQIVAPISLVSVIVTVFAIYIGSFVRTAPEASVPIICLHEYATGKYTLLANKEIWRAPKISDLMNDPRCYSHCGITNVTEGKIVCAPGITGYDAKTFKDNAMTNYMKSGEAAPGRKGVTAKGPMREIVQDQATTFFVMLGIYFPSVTGIMTGSNMSGDLADPQKSIPIGTIAAQVTTTFVYLTFVILFGGTIRKELLWDKLGGGIGDHMVVAELVEPAFIIVSLGAFLSTLGAGLQSLCSAPRLLYSIAKDGVIPFLGIFSRRDKRNEPIIGLFFTTGVAFLFVLLGTVDHVAPVVDSFFLLCYAFVNVSCALMSFLSGPNWRPRFRFYHWSLSVLGTLLAFFCFLGNFIAHPLHGSIAVMICLPTFVYISMRGSKKEWGHGVKGMYLSLAQKFLLKIEEKEHQPKNWRPHLMVISRAGNESVRRKLIAVASQLGSGKGLAMCCSMMEGDPGNKSDKEGARALQQQVRAELLSCGVAGFAKTVLYNRKELGTAVSILIQSAGITGLKPNTLLVAWPMTWKEQDNELMDFLERVHRGAAQDMCLIIPKGIYNWPEHRISAGGTIDIWWIFIDGGLVLLLAFLLKRGEVWELCHLRLFAIAEEGEDAEEVKGQLETYLYEIRIKADVYVVTLQDFETSVFSKMAPEKLEERERELKTLPEEEQNLIRLMERKDAEKSAERSRRQEEKEEKEEKADQETRRQAKLKSTRILNRAMVSKSMGSELVLLNLPKPPKRPGKMRDYMELLENATESLQRVLLIRGSGKEFVTIYY